MDERGQSAVTHYKTLLTSNIQTENGDIFTVLECRIETGRTHQIRVHLAYHGCPILGDSAYGKKGVNSYMKRRFGIDRQLLHARSLIFDHPVTKKRLTIEAPYPEDFEKLIS